MFSMNDTVFSPSWKPYAKRLASLAVTLVIVAFSAYKFHTVLNANLLYFVLVILCVLLMTLVPIYAGRREDREELYIRHLRTLPISKLEIYAQKAATDKEKDLVDAVLGEKLYGHL
jgi:hypothetical protein